MICPGPREPEYGQRCVGQLAGPAVEHDLGPGLLILQHREGRDIVDRPRFAALHGDHAHIKTLQCQPQLVKPAAGPRQQCLG